MSPHRHTVQPRASRPRHGVARMPWCETGVLTGGIAGGLGLVVVDQGNPRRSTGAANIAFALSS